MDRDALNDLAQQMLDLVALRAREPVSAAPQRVDLAHYLDPAQHRREREELFRRTPLFMAWSTELPAPGSVKTNDYTGVPVLMVRGRDNRVRAFLNACRHRGGRIVDEPGAIGTRKSLSCRYHGWAYGLDGALNGVADEPQFGCIDKAGNGLIELPCEEGHGMVFVCATPGLAFSLDEHLGPELAAELADWRFDTLQRVDAGDIATRANWKFQFDSFLEAYHVAQLHKDTIGPLSLGGYALHRFYGRHQRMVFAASSLPQLRDQPREQWDAHRHLTVVYTLFPNINITFGKLWVQSSQLYPGETVDTQTTNLTVLCRKPMLSEEQQAGGRAYFDLTMKFVSTEDYLMGRQVTEGAMTGLMRHHLFGANEAALRHQHEQLRDALGIDPRGLYVNA